ncbi:GNAT family N-acetyltransferase [Paenibacillus sp. sptzw28]|uniref:GNAT family N-acetyltransferase n=1 Tax=Paenibacillus sp. sptzw28 TaxID=715179 RepID=UPI001C6EF847|nr:GNAT family N-acetyltransferase [Paenibacillus sp. sptzw28]QYR19324.1 GNAT family N-acetyltransferase [Paenibacillus sp. sptzw28]
MINLKEFKDRSEVKRLIAQCMWPDDERIEKELNKYMESDSRELLGYINNNELVGLIGVVYESIEKVELKHIAVKAGYRGNGIGSYMLNEFIQTRKTVRIKAETDKDAVGFYRKFGFAIMSLGEKYPGVERFECVYPSGLVAEG